MRVTFEQKSLAKILTKSVVVDVGGGTPFQKNLNASPRKPSNLFLSIDISPASNPTIRADIHFLPLKNESADAVICRAVLEHVNNPFLVVSEIHRLLRPEGIAYIWVPFLYPYHPNKNYGDFFRYTSAGVKLLFRNFSTVEIQPSLGYFASINGLLPSPLSRVFHVAASLLDKLVTVSEQNAGWHILAAK